MTSNLKWEFDGGGTWTAASQIIDPDMTDEDPEKWCKEWCLQWVIYIDEEGQFCHDHTDKLLFRECEVMYITQMEPPLSDTNGSRSFKIRYSDASLLRAFNKHLEVVQNRIQQIEEHLRGQENFNNGSKVVLLPKEVYER